MLTNLHEDYIMVRTYNSEKTLGPTLERALELFPQGHLVLTDDGSEDKTKDIIRTFDRTHPGRVHAFFYPHRGVSATLKSVFVRTLDLVNNSSARTAALFSCDSDDFLEAGSVEASQKIQKGADFCFLPFQHQKGYIHRWTQPAFYNWVPEHLSADVQFFDDLSRSEQKKMMEHMALGYPFKALSGDMLTRFTKIVVPYFPSDGCIGEDIPSVLCPLFKGTLITGVATQAYTYIKHSGSATDTSTTKKRKKEIEDKTFFAQLP